MTEARAFNGFGTNFEGSPEPIYGQLFLPRKFKIAVTVPGDNSVDLLTNDLGIVLIADEAGAVLGYDLLVGGGMGRTNRRARDRPCFFQALVACALAEARLLCCRRAYNSNNVILALVSKQLDVCNKHDTGSWQAGGGSSRFCARRNAATYARLADALGFVAKDDILHAVKAIVATQRDYGRRDDRKMSRLKYLVDEWGLPKFRSVVEQYYGKKLEPFRCGALGLQSGGNKLESFWCGVLGLGLGGRKLEPFWCGAPPARADASLTGVMVGLGLGRGRTRAGCAHTRRVGCSCLPVISASLAMPLYLEFEGRLLMDGRLWQESAPRHGAARMQLKCAGASGTAHTGLAQGVNRRALLRRPLPAWEFKDYLGWMEQGDGKLAYGIFIANGRLKGARRAGWPAPASHAPRLWR